ncbi:AAA family ATPase [Bizionia myxarmorum]|uniref:ATP-binding protein n=1 Tax=Bizionia myxarmorum TaxID=291186 RepID=A0A5D0QYS9_9FLAO|nr:ATP-binding protein [Bizionia myxarmorum]TYB74360.1 ATP-binding protein [Bizionia myxarmorum]
MNIKKIVITGGPGTGKTSIINELKDRGYVCLDEISRQVTLKAREDGVEQLFLTQPLLFSEMLLEGREAQFNQANTQHESVVFLDRGIPDVLAYMDFIGDSIPGNFEESCKNHFYDLAFILKPWQDIFISDSERYENFNQAVEIHDNLLKTYEKYGYNLLDVPFDTIENRSDYILNVVKNL